MSGGTISGNESSGGSSYGGGVYLSVGSFTKSGGTNSWNETSGGSSYGGGVYVYNAVFKKEPESPATTSGVIYGENEGGNSNTVKDAYGDLLPDRGHAVYVDSSPAKKRDSTVTADKALSAVYDSGISGYTFTGDWDL
jgi:hypothetical protein